VIAKKLSIMTWARLLSLVAFKAATFKSIFQPVLSAGMPVWTNALIGLAEVPGLEELEACCG
jgi:hypothetical protein